MLWQGSGHLLHQRLGQMGLGGLAGGQALAQVGAQAAQLGYAGDDAGLFGEGWQTNQRMRNIISPDSRNRDAD